MKPENKIPEVNFDRGIQMEIICPGTHIRLLKPLSLEEWLRGLSMGMQARYKWKETREKAYDKYCQGIYRAQCRILKQFGVAQRKYRKELKKYVH